jgi:hypothetical protein
MCSVRREPTCFTARVNERVPRQGQLLGGIHEITGIFAAPLRHSFALGVELEEAVGSIPSTGRGSLTANCRS